MFVVSVIQPVKCSKMNISNNKIVAGKTILLNTVTDCTFLAGASEEKTQLKQENVEHIQIAGELSIGVKVIEEPYEFEKEKEKNFLDKLEGLINSFSKENGSNTPDFILAQYLNDCLEIWNKNVMKRSDWYGNVDRIGGLKIITK